MNSLDKRLRDLEGTFQQGKNEKHVVLYTFHAGDKAHEREQRRKAIEAYEEAHGCELSDDTTTYIAVAIHSTEDRQ